MAFEVLNLKTFKDLRPEVFMLFWFVPNAPRPGLIHELMSWNQKIKVVIKTENRFWPIKSH